MMKLKLIGFFLLFGCVTSFAQYKEMLHKPYKDKIEAIDVLYRNTINKNKQDSLHIKTYTHEMEQWALANNDKELALEAELLRAYANWFFYGDKKLELIQNLIEVAQKGNTYKVYHIEERAIQVIATHYWSFKDYETAFEWLLQSAKILDKMEPESFPNMANHLNFIGRSYYHFEDYTNALTYFIKSSNIKKTAFNAADILGAQNTVGLCYQKLGELELAKTYFLKVINDTSPYKNTAWIGIASGNLGYNYYLKGNFEKAIPLFKKDIEEALKNEDYGLASGSATPLADIYLKQHKLTEAKQKIDEARKYIKLSKQTDRLHKLYPIMSKWYAANNQLALSTTYLDSTMIAINAFNEKYSGIKLLRANQKVEAKERELEVGKLKTESKLKITQRNFIILFIVLLLIISIFSFWFRNQYLLKKQEIKELALDKTQKELEKAESQLKNLTIKIREDNRLITELKKDKVSKNSANILSDLKTKNILTQNDWSKFQSTFKKVYPNFISSFTAAYPDISQAEIRCLCLEKLQLTNSEMALILGVSTNTIRVTKHRIRKKLNKHTEENLEKLLKEFG
ncbi:tetratricopeptide repeat protein [Polaribacter uvawellassae]|uniref:tetratricopeptide repeat protein n=1 Tax=Polaribacter uvawellassae TaxID=3133495 RepID=UPI003219AFE9